jgi:hypothetical protein
MYRYIVHWRKDGLHGDKKFHTFKWALLWARAHGDFAIMTLAGKYLVMTKGFLW